MVFLKQYPGSNNEEFEDRVVSESERQAVRDLFAETAKISMVRNEKSLNGIGDEAERIMHQRHPGLSDAALDSLANYFTYLVRCEARFLLANDAA